MFFTISVKPKKILKKSLTNAELCGILNKRYLKGLFNACISRSGAGVARRAHNPKVEGSNPSSATSRKATPNTLSILWERIFMFISQKSFW